MGSTKSSHPDQPHCLVSGRDVGQERLRWGVDGAFMKSAVT